MGSSELVTVSEVAKWGRYSRSTVEGWIADGAIQVARVAGTKSDVVKVPKRALWQFLGGGKSVWRTYEQFREDWREWVVDTELLRRRLKELPPKDKD